MLTLLWVERISSAIAMRVHLRFDYQPVQTLAVEQMNAAVK
jgi:hypothetical protein